MNIDLSKLQKDVFGHIESPQLILKRKTGETLGILYDSFDISTDIKYNELSSASFSYPDMGRFYDEIVQDRVVEIRPYGVFIVADTDVEYQDGRVVKTVSLYSREYELAGRKLQLGAGTYRLYSPTDNTETLMGMIKEKTRLWSIGSVPSSLWNIYRTFDDIDVEILDFLYNNIQESYGCIVEFDTFDRIINIKDANADTVMLPIYMSKDNLVKRINIRTAADSMANRISVYGADGVTIRDVNPTGTNEIIDLGYAISIGDIPDALVSKYISWKNAIIANQDYYSSVVALRNATYSRYLTENAKLTDLKGELTTLENTRATTLKMLNTTNDPTTITEMEERLEEISDEYVQKEDEIDEQQDLVDAIHAEYEGFIEQLQAINDDLKLESFFTDSELDILDPFFIDGEISDSTFAVFDVDISNSDDSFTAKSSVQVLLSDVSLRDIQTSEVVGRRIFDISGGSITLTADEYECSAELVHATMDHKSNGEVVLSAYVGAGTVNGTSVMSGNITVTGISTFDDDDIIGDMEEKVETITDDATGVSYDIVSYEGDVGFTCSDSNVYFTKNATEYQRYSVEQELFDYATGRISELAYPTSEFEIESCDIVYAQDFAAFRDAIKLGCGVYLQLDDDLLLKPILLELHFDFNDLSKFSMVFSNQFQIKRPDEVNKLKNILQRASNTSRTLDLSRYEFGSFDSSGAHSQLDKFFSDGLDAAYQQVTAGSGQTVTINGGGIKVASEDSTEYILMANGMIAIVDTETKETKAAIGHFYNKAIGTDFNGVLADVIGGTLLAGRYLDMECYSPTGAITQFKFDGTGAFLNNSRFYLQSDSGGRIGLDPEHGFIAGTSSLFDVTDTGIVKPSCIDDDGELILDSDGFPQDTNVYIGIDGKAYFRGTVYATDGNFTGDVYARNFYFQDGDDVKTLLDEATKEFDLSSLNKIDLGSIVIDGTTGSINFAGAGSITWGSNTPVKYQFSISINGPWHDTMQSSDRYRRDSTDGGQTWGSPYQFVGKDGEDGADGSDAEVPDYIRQTYIDGTRVSSFHIEANRLEAVCPVGSDESDDSVGFVLTGAFSDSSLEYLRIFSYDSGMTPYTVFESPSGAYASWRFGFTSMHGTIDFSGADVTGLIATFA